MGIFGPMNFTKLGQAKPGGTRIALILSGTHISQRRDEFALHGMADVVTLTHRNVCKDGFTVADTVDAGQ